MFVDSLCGRRCALVALLLALAVLPHPFASAATPSHSPAEVELFAAIERGEVEVVFIPRDSKKVTIQVANKTDRPLAVRLPEAFAGVPVLAQIFPPPGGGPLAGGGAQAVGVRGGGAGNPPFGLMNIPAGKIVKVKRPAVCLEHGKPEPGPRMKYRIAPLATVTDDASVRELLTNYPIDRNNQRIAQLAAWHLANGKTWEELDALTVTNINRQVSRQFSRDEIRAARKLVEALPSQKASSSAGESISQR